MGFNSVFKGLKRSERKGDSFGDRVHRRPTASHIYLDNRSHRNLANTEARHKPKTPSITTMCMMIWNFSSKPPYRKATVSRTMPLSRSCHIRTENSSSVGISYFVRTSSTKTQEAAFYYKNISLCTVLWMSNKILYVHHRIPFHTPCAKDVR